MNKYMQMSQKLSAILLTLDALYMNGSEIACLKYCLFFFERDVSVDISFYRITRGIMKN